MSKRTLISLVLVVVLLFSAVSPAWAGSIALPDADNVGSLTGSDLIRPMGDCEDGSAGGWC
jgi:hypothetical protein